MAHSSQIVFEPNLCDRVKQACASKSEAEMNATVDKLLSEAVEGTSVAEVQDGCILKLLLHAAHYDLDVASFKSMCTTFSLPVTIATIYESRKDRLRSLLAHTGYQAPEILDIDWKLMHTTDQTSLSHDGCMYEITLKVRDCASQHIRDVQFFASLEQLQDMLWKLKEAGAAVARLEALRTS